MSATRPIELLDERELALIHQAREFGAQFACEAAQYDRRATIAFAHLHALRESGYLAAAVPREYGGEGASLLAIALAQAALAEGDPATALGVSMHFMVTGQEGWVPAWPRARREAMFREVVSGNVLLNVLATEQELGSPQGPFRPATTLTPGPRGLWRLRGHKIFATFAEALTHAVVFASIEDGSGDVGMAVVSMDDPRVAIQPAWDTVGMRATASHDVLFEDVPLCAADILSRRPGSFSATRPAMSPWFLLPVTAVYLGIARSARQYAVAYARARRPGGGPPLRTQPHIRALIARIDSLVYTCESMLLTAALAAGQDLGRAPRVIPVEPIEAATKAEVTARACEVVDLAMRVVGGSGLHRHSPLERCYRDVRSGPVHPPSDARAIEILASAAFDIPNFQPGLQGTQLFRGYLNGVAS